MRSSVFFRFLIGGIASFSLSTAPIYAMYDPMHEQTGRLAWWVSGVLLGAGAGVGIGYAIADGKKSKKKDKTPVETPEETSPRLIPPPPSSFSIVNVDMTTEVSFVIDPPSRSDNSSSSESDSSSSEKEQKALVTVKYTLFNPIGIVLFEQVIQEQLIHTLGSDTIKVLGSHILTMEVVQGTSGNNQVPVSLGKLTARVVDREGQTKELVFYLEEKANWRSGDIRILYFDVV